MRPRHERDRRRGQAERLAGRRRRLDRVVARIVETSSSAPTSKHAEATYVELESA